MEFLGVARGRVEKTDSEIDSSRRKENAVKQNINLQCQYWPANSWLKNKRLTSM